MKTTTGEVVLSLPSYEVVALYKRSLQQQRTTTKALYDIGSSRGN